MCIINEIGKARLNENCVRLNKQFLISSHTDLYGLEKDFSFGLYIKSTCQICGITNNKFIRTTTLSREAGQFIEGPLSHQLAFNRSCWWLIGRYWRWIWIWIASKAWAWDSCFPYAWNIFFLRFWTVPYFSKRKH